MEHLEGRLLLTAFVVNSTGDEPDFDLGDGIANIGVPDPDHPGRLIPASPPITTFRAAIEQANADAGLDMITFEVSEVSSANFPEITSEIMIDGDERSIALLGSPLVIHGTNSTIRGVVVASLDIYGDGSVVEGSFIGVDRSGAMASGGGITVYASGTTIGGATEESRNVIGATDGGFALVINGDRNLVIGNSIGVTLDGDTALANNALAYGGINIYGGDQNTIGGTLPNERNTISGFTGSLGVGIRLDGSFTEGPVGNTILGNRIGTNAAGTTAIPNNYGIHVLNAEADGKNTIGGTTADAGNIISGNVHNGMLVQWSDNIDILGNLIGTHANGVDAIGNGNLGPTSAGVYVVQGSQQIVIGGIQPGEGNKIAFNAGPGIYIAGPASNNPLRGNSIWANSWLGIDLAPSGVTPNDVEPGSVDSDEGPNRTQNYPQLTLSETGAGLQASLESTPSQQFTIDAYASDVVEAHPSGYGAGKEYLGSFQLSTDGDGKGQATAPFAVPAGKRITATATDMQGNTSEFSRFAVFPGFIVNSIGDAPDSNLSDGRCGTGSTTAGGESECTLRAAIMQANQSTARDSIAFDIPGTGPHTIRIRAACVGSDCGLPPIVHPLSIDGLTQPGSRPGDEEEPAVWQVVVKPQPENESSGGLVIRSSDVTVRGLSIQEFAGTGIRVESGSRQLIEQNQIADNHGAGVAILAGTANELQRNSIFGNDGIGIDLGGDKITPNDPTQLRSGPNNLQPFPIIELANRNSTETVVSGTLPNPSHQAARIDFFATDTREATRLEHGIQGQRFLGTLHVAAQNTAFAHFEAHLPPTEDYEVITATATDPTGNSSEFSPFTPDFAGDPPDESIVSEFRTPVIVVPGFFGSMPTSLPTGDPANYSNWLQSHGANPNTIVLDPILRGYDDLVRTLKNTGYVEGIDLFQAPYDWRLPIAPSSLVDHGRDGVADGLIQGVTAAEIADSVFNYSLDYLGRRLAEVAEAWHAVHGQPLTSVHLVSHSMGGLLSRAYIQSSAYGGPFRTESGVDLHLPMVTTVTMFGVPNQGSPVVFPAWYDDFSADPSYVLVLSKVIKHAWDLLQNGSTIRIREGDTTTLLTRDDPRFAGLSAIEQRKVFARLYVPGMRDLQPSYEGVNSGGFTLEPGSYLLKDLNSRVLDGTLQLGSRVAQGLSLFGADVETSTTLQARTGPEFKVVRGTVVPTSAINSFADIWPRVPGSDETWYEDQRLPANGDGTVPLPSLRLFSTDPLVEQIEYCNDACSPGRRSNGDGVAHTELPYNRDAQALLLDRLGHPIPADQISYSRFVGEVSKLRSAWRFSTYNVVTDPVQTLLVDSAGRRLGWSEATGPVQEIPNSVYLGGAVGIGWVLPTDSDALGPLQLQLAGLGEDYGVQVTGYRANNIDGVEQHGTLAAGQTLSLDVPAPTFDFTADLDGNGTADPLSDGVLLRRYLAGMRGDALIANAVAPDAEYVAAQTIEEYLAAATLDLFDVDSNGKVESDSDGQLIQRFMAGFRGDALVAGLVDPTGGRTDVAEITQYLGEQLVLAVAVPSTFSERKQVLTNNFNGSPVTPGESIAVTFRYDATTPAAEIPGLAFRVHFDSHRLEYDGLAVLEDAGFDQSQVLDDRQANFDDDVRTDKYVLISWSTPLEPWLGSSDIPADLVTLQFTTPPDFLGASLKVTAAGTAAGYTLTAATIPVSSTLVPASSWQNPLNRLDVNEDGFVVPIDVLIIINELNARKFADSLGRLPSLRPVDAHFFDINNDGFAVPLDALTIINFLNSAQGEGELRLKSGVRPGPAEPVTNSARVSDCFDEEEAHQLLPFESPIWLDPILDDLSTDVLRSKLNKPHRNRS